MVESNRLSDRPLPLVERELQARIEAETAARFRQRRRAAKVARRIAALPSTVLDGEIVLVQAASEPWDPQPAPAAPTVIDLPAEAMHDVMSSSEFALPEPEFEEPALPKRRTRRRPRKPRIFEETFTDVDIVVDANATAEDVVDLRTQPSVEPDVEPVVEPIIDLVAPPSAPKRSPWRRVRSAKVADRAPAPLEEPVTAPVPAARVVFEPVAVEPILEEPVVVEPAVVAAPVVVEPVIVEPEVVAEPEVIAEPVVVEPEVVAEPVVVEPVVVEPAVVAEPVVVEPAVVVEPVVVEPVVVEPVVVVPEVVEPEIVEPIVVEPEIVEAVPAAASWKPSNSLWTDRVFNTVTRFRESQTVAWPPQWKPAADVVDLADDSESDQVDASRP